MTDSGRPRLRCLLPADAVMTADPVVPAGAVVTADPDMANDPDANADPETNADADMTVTRLYKEYGAFITSYVTGLLADRHLAEDVVQETMLRAWRHCSAFSAEKGSVRGWLVRVAHNLVMDEFRARRARPTEVAEDSVAEAPLDDHADAVVTALRVRDALALLSPGHRAVLEQVYLNDCTAREAASRLGIPEGTAFSRAFYALRVLRRELGVAASAETAPVAA